MDEIIYYTYTVFDGNPARAGSCEWDHMSDVEIEVEIDSDPDEILDEILADACAEAGDEYGEGDRLWAIVWDSDGEIVATGSREIDGDER